MIALAINGKSYNVDVESNTPLLWVLRDTIGLTGTKYGCGIALCGACTVHIDGVATRSCQVPVGTVGSKNVTTIEALAQNGKLHPVQKAWLDLDVPQCGYCQSGMIMAAASLLKQNQALQSHAACGPLRGCRGTERSNRFGWLSRCVRAAKNATSRQQSPDAPSRKARFLIYLQGAKSRACVPPIDTLFTVVAKATGSEGRG